MALTTVYNNGYAGWVNVWPFYTPWVEGDGDKSAPGVLDPGVLELYVGQSHRELPTLQPVRLAERLEQSWNFAEGEQPRYIREGGTLDGCRLGTKREARKLKYCHSGLR